MTPDQMLLLLDSFFDTLRGERGSDLPQEWGIAADLLDDLGRPDEARNLRKGDGTLVRLPATKKSPARIVVLLARVAREQCEPNRSIYLVSCQRWRVNGVVVGRLGTKSGNLATRIRHVYAIELTPTEVRLLGKKVFSTLS